MLTTNISNGVLTNSVWWSKEIGAMGEPKRVQEIGLSAGSTISADQYPW